MTEPSTSTQAAELAMRQARALASPADLGAQMDYGAALHEAGQPERALVTFEKAMRLQPDNIDAVSACATLLFELGRPQAAYQVLASVRHLLLATADGAANLGVAAEACGQVAQARACYEQALALDPNNVRALNNLALQAAGEGRWDTAVNNARRCVELMPDEPMLWVNLCDVLVGSRNYAGALVALQRATQRYPGIAELAVRHIAALAFNAEFDKADAAIRAMDPQAQTLLREYLRTAATGDEVVKKAPMVLPTARELFSKQAFEAMQVCDWRYHDKLVQALRDMLDEATRTGATRDWRESLFYGALLPLHEDEVARMRTITGQTIAAASRNPTAPFMARRAPPRDGRLHIGLTVQNLRDPRFANALARQLALHDASRFAIHVYAPTPVPEARLTEALQPHAAGVVEIAHMTDDEATARIRLDQLDLFMDMAYNTPWCRPEIPARRVAPVQIRQLVWDRHHATSLCEYNMSDTFVHPDASEVARYGPVVRLPHTCWIATNDDLPEAPASRADAGLPEDALVLCAFVPTVMVDPQSFTLWMQMLRALPDAVLLLPAFPPAARANLMREATGAGVLGERLVFPAQAIRDETLARMALADLFVDTVRFNANHGLVDALRMGVPAVSCAGQSMASRLGGSIIRAAGLPDCVYSDTAAYKDAVVTLGRDRGALQALRARLAAARPTAPLFDAAARVKEWEAAWTIMIERQRAGLAPEAFDVPSQAS